MDRSYCTQPVSPASSSNNFQWLIVAAIFAVLFVQYSNQGWPFAPKTDPAPVVPIDDQQAIDDSPAKGDAAWVVVVEETKGRPAARQIVLDDYDFWFKELPEKKIRVRLFDDDDPSCESYLYRAKAADVDAPFVMIVDDSGGVKEIAPFPDSVDVIRKLIK